MPTGTVKSLRVAQLGRESTAARGTAVAATERLLADCELNLDYPLYRNEHPIGIPVRSEGPTATIKKAVDVALSWGGISYEQLLWPLGLAFSQPVTTGAFTHTFDPGAAAVLAPFSGTLEGRWTDGVVPEDIRVPYLMARKITLKGDQSGQLAVEFDGFGRPVVDPGTVTALTIPTNLEIIPTALCRLYMNDTFALADVSPPVAGQMTNQVVSWEWVIDTGLFPWWSAGDNSLGFTEHKAREWDTTLKLTVLYDATTSGAPINAASERAKAQTESFRFATLYAAGTSSRAFRLAGSFKYETSDFLKVGEQDGYDVIDLSLLGHYDPTSTKMLKGVVVNGDAGPQPA